MNFSFRFTDNLSISPGIYPKENPYFFCRKSIFPAYSIFHVSPTGLLVFQNILLVGINSSSLGPTVVKKSLICNSTVRAENFTFIVYLHNLRMILVSKNKNVFNSFPSIFHVTNIVFKVSNFEIFLFCLSPLRNRLYAIFVGNHFQNHFTDRWFQSFVNLFPI